MLNVSWDAIAWFTLALVSSLYEIAHLRSCVYLDHIYLVWVCIVPSVLLRSLVFLLYHPCIAGALLGSRTEERQQKINDVVSGRILLVFLCLGEYHRFVAGVLKKNANRLYPGT